MNAPSGDLIVIKNRGKRRKSRCRIDLNIGVEWDRDDPTGPPRAGAALAKVLKILLPPERQLEALRELEAAIQENFQTDVGRKSSE